MDEKTLAYNDLLNQQKEFISVISHEIKSPIANAIFQADSVLDDLENGKISNEELQSELQLLNTQLINAGDLTNRLFAIQYFETRTVTLFREKIQIVSLLETEYDVYSHLYENIRFINRISPDIGFVDVDKVQLQQVITNLLGNAVKFLDKENPCIIIEAFKRDDMLHIIFEDSGRGFE